MKNKWRRTTLGQSCVWYSGGTPSKRNPEFWNGEIPWISASSMTGLYLDDSDLKITREGAEAGSRIVPARTILLLVRGSILHQRIPVGLTTKDVAFNQDVKAIVPREDLLPEFVLYWLLANEKVLLNKVENTGIGAGKLPTAILNSMEIPCPLLDVQQRIAFVLTCLDDKIELNRRMNRTLEKMAATTFKSWFIDFDPVHAKAEARDPNLPAEIADLFPASFEDSALGPIPKGWKCGSLDDVADSPRRGVKPSDVPPTTPYIGLEHMPRRNIALDSWGRAKDVASGKSQFKQREILYGKLRPYFHKVGIAPVDGVCSTDIVVVRPQSKSWHGYVISLISSKPFVDYTDSHSAGTKMPRTNWKDMSRYPLAMPPEPLARAFQDYVEALHTRIGTNVRQNRCLAGLRDTLLPGLLNGEIEIPAAEAVVEGVQ